MNKKYELKCFVSAVSQIETKQIRDIVQQFGIETRDAFDFSPCPGLNNAEELRGKLAGSDFIVGVISELSSNVFYEIGVAQGLGKAVFLIVLGNEVLPAALDSIGYVRVEKGDLSQFREQFTFFVESLRRRKKKHRYGVDFVNELRLELDTEADIEKIGSCVSAVALRNKEVADKLVKTLDTQKLKTKLLAQADLKNVGSCISAIANVNKEVATQLVREFAFEELKEIALEDSHANVRATAAKVLAGSASYDVLPLIEDMLEDANWNVRKAAVDALGRLSSHSDLPLIEDMLEDANWNVRKAAVEALGKIASAHDIFLIEKMLRDEDYQVRKAATQTLNKVEPSSLGNYLTEAERLRKEGDERKIEELLARVFKRFSVVCTTSHGVVEGTGADMSVWVDSLQAVWGNPIIVELKFGRLSKSQLSQAQRQMHSYLMRTNAKAGLVIYLDRTGRRFVMKESPSPNILCIELSDLIRDLGELTFEEVVARERNALVHRKGA